jgi:hypothetical protein
VSEAARGLAGLGPGCGNGGARPFPLPNILPPPSFRPDMVGGLVLWPSAEKGVAARVGPQVLARPGPVSDPQELLSKELRGIPFRRVVGD